MIRKTRFKELGYEKIKAGNWQFIDLTDGRRSQIGISYHSKEELLSNLTAFAAEFGCAN